MQCSVFFAKRCLHFTNIKPNLISSFSDVVGNWEAAIAIQCMLLHPLTYLLCSPFCSSPVRSNWAIATLLLCDNPSGIITHIWQNPGPFLFLALLAMNIFKIFCMPRLMFSVPFYETAIYGNFSVGEKALLTNLIYTSVQAVIFICGIFHSHLCSFRTHKH